MCQEAKSIKYAAWYREQMTRMELTLSLAEVEIKSLPEYHQCPQCAAIVAVAGWRAQGRHGRCKCGKLLDAHYPATRIDPCALIKHLTNDITDLGDFLQLSQAQLAGAITPDAAGRLAQKITDARRRRQKGRARRTCHNYAARIIDRALRQIREWK